ncbi:MAG: 5,10-methylenetetrahydrofolate reductase [Spirochaetales bacterium]|nr:MAG: 5,10-methylenetetrahydrofolate reductase [Spirochaetales bacterium]
MSVVLDTLACSRERISIEVVPPARGADPDRVLSCVDAVMPWDPAFVSVTNHPAGRVWVDDDGTPRSVPIRSKPGTLGLCVAIRSAADVAVVPHAVCIGNDSYRAEDELIDFRYAEFHDVFVVRGDVRFAPFSEAPRGGFSEALELVRLASAMNRGEYSGGATAGRPAGLSIGVAAYPEKHPAAANPDSDMAAFRAKVEAGAEWSLTQMLFDARVYSRFVERARGVGLRIPIIPGIKPLCSLKSLSSVPGTFFVNVPQELASELEDAPTPAEGRLVGLRHAARLCRDLYDAGAPCIHFFTMGRARDTVDTLAAVFGLVTGKGTPL